MTGSPPSPVPGAREPGTSGPADDPLAADKRTLIIALIAMVLLVSVGIVSAAVFTGSACEDVSPAPVTAGGASDDVAESLAVAFPDADDAAIAGVTDQLEAVGERLGDVTGVAIVDGAERLTSAGDGLAAAGPTTSLVAASGAEITAVADIGDGVVVGSGDTLVSLARVNDLTGQVDAFATIDATASGGLTEIGCVDTATVGTPLAFEVDAAGGQLLLFRADEDGAEAELELRDPRQGRLWSARLDVGEAPPGVTGERIDGRLDDEVAVLARRTAPDDVAPLVTVVDRADGALRWQVGREALRSVPVTTSADGAADDRDLSVVRDDVAQRLEVLALDDEQVVLAVTVARDEDAVVAGGTDALGPSVGPGALVAFDLVDGSPRWQRPLPADVEVSAIDSSAAGIWLVFDQGDRADLVGLDGAGNAIDGPTQRVVAVAGERLVVVDSGGEQPVDDDEQPLRARDVLMVDDRVHVLFSAPVSAGLGPQPRELVVTFASGG